jgi:hypothetical protein
MTTAGSAGGSKAHTCTHAALPMSILVQGRSICKRSHPALPGYLIKLLVCGWVCLATWVAALQSCMYHIHAHCSFVPVYSSSTHACVLLAQVGHHSPQALLVLARHSTGHSMLRWQHLHNSPLPLFATGTHRHPLTCLKKNHTDHMRQ